MWASEGRTKSSVDRRISGPRDRGRRRPCVAHRLFGLSSLALLPLLIAACSSSTMSGSANTSTSPSTTQQPNTYPTYEFVCTKPDRTDVAIDILQLTAEHVTQSRSRKVADVFCTVMLLVSNPEPVLEDRPLPSPLGEEMIQQGQRAVVGMNVTLLPFPNFLPIGTLPPPCPPSTEGVVKSLTNLMTQRPPDESKAARTLECANHFPGI